MRACLSTKAPCSVQRRINPYDRYATGTHDASDRTASIQRVQRSGAIEERGRMLSTAELEWGRWQVPDGSSASQTTLVSIAAPLI